MEGARQGTEGRREGEREERRKKMRREVDCHGGNITVIGSFNAN